MERIRAMGCQLPCRALLAALLLLTGLQVKALTTPASSHWTEETSLAATLVSPKLTLSIEDTSSTTPSERLTTNVLTSEAESKASPHDLEHSTLPDNVKVSADTTNEVSSTNATNSSTSIQTTVTSLNTTAVSINPNSTAVSPLNTTAESINPNSTEVTPLNTTAVSIDPNSTVSTNMTSIFTVSKPSTPQISKHTSGPTDSRTETVTEVSQTDAGSTHQMGHTGSTSSSTKDDNLSTPAVTLATHSSGTKFSSTYNDLTGSSAFTSASNSQMSSVDQSTEHNIERPKALSPGSVAAITIIVIVLVLVIFGGAAYWKIRHSSYGRLLEDQDYGSLGNYNNPLYDDS